MPPPKMPTTTKNERILVSRAQKDFVYHTEVVQGVTTLEDYQKNILRACNEYDRIAIFACHDVGKTFTMSKVVLAIGSSFPGSKIITTAPNMTLVEKLLWSEIRAGHRTSKYPLGGRMLNKEWQFRDDWFAIGISPREEGGDNNNASSNFQGFHAPKIFVLFDEATGIPPKRYVQAEGMMTSANVIWVCIGNPTSRSSPFFQLTRDPMWHKIYITCFDSPNVKANGIYNMNDLKKEVERCQLMNDRDVVNHVRNYVVVKPQLLTLQWVIRMALKWGMTHPLFVSKALGQFPEEEDNVIAPLALVEESQRAWQDLHDKPRDNVLVRSVGVDPARYGTDKTVISIFEDKVQTHRIAMSKVGTTEITGKIVSVLKELTRARREIVVIDGTGLGAGVVDELKDARTSKDLPPNVIIKEVHFGESCDDEDDKKDYQNMKAKIFDQLRRGLKEGIAIMDEQIYLEELPTIIYRFTARGQLSIESKDDYKKRTGMASPDDSDSLALAIHGLALKAGTSAPRDDKKKTRERSTHAGNLSGGRKW